MNFTEADKNETDKFVTAQFGKRFMTAFIDETQAFEPRKKNAMRSKNPDADGFAINRPENLNKLLNKSVADKYKI